jgi:hypothetical protein
MTRHTLLAAMLLSVLLAACSGTGYDVEAAQDLIAGEADAAYPELAPFEVECEDPPAAAVEGATFTCTATDAEDGEREFLVTGTDDQGNVEIQEQ